MRDPRPRWWCPLPGLEGSYDGELEAFADGPVVELVLTTHNPNYGGASGMGSWTPRCLRAADPLPGYHEVQAGLQAWVARLPAEPCSPSARAVLDEPVEEALVALADALRAADADGASAAYRRAATTLRNLLPDRVWLAARGSSRWPPDAEAAVQDALARWRAAV